MNLLLVEDDATIRELVRHLLQIELLDGAQASLAITTYHSNRLFLIGIKEGGRLSVFQRRRASAIISAEDIGFDSPRGAVTSRRT